MYQYYDRAKCGPLVKRLRRRPLTPQTGVRLSYGSPHLIRSVLNSGCIFQDGKRFPPGGTYTLLTNAREDIIISLFSGNTDCIVGVFSDEEPPVPIPNTAVKLISAEDTWLETARENRSMPTQIFLNSSVGRACGC